MQNDNFPPRSGGLSGFLNYFLRSYRVTFLLLVGLVILGLWTAVTLPRESTPEVEIPVAVVLTPYPGASARDVEELVTKPIEDELIDIAGLDNLTSSSRLGISSVVAEFSADEDLNDAIRRLRDKVSAIHNLPDEAKSPEVMEINFEDEPIISISLGGIEDKRLLSLYAKKLAADIEKIAAVSQVDVIGSIDEEVTIKIDPNKLAAIGLNPNQVIGSIRAANLDAPFGQLETNQFNYDLRLTGRFAAVGDIAQIPILLPNGQVVQLDTIADVDLALTERSTASRMSIAGQDSTPAVTLSVRKKTGGNIVRLVNTIKEKVEQAQRDLPPALQVVTFANRADDIHTQLSNVYTSGVQTLIIVFTLLWLFLGWRPAAITSLAVPVTFAMAFLVIAQTKTTLNGISLFSLILSLGLLVDTAIVIVEGICGQHQDEAAIVNHRGLDTGNGLNKTNSLRRRAAMVVDQFTKPLIGGTLTTIAAFFPMLLVTGIIGQFLRVIPLVVTATLMSSLLVALAFIPPVAVQILARTTSQPTQNRWFDNVFFRFRQWYNKIINNLLEVKRLQTLFIAGLSILLVIGLSLPFTGILKTSLFPTVDIDFMIINVELDPGTRLEQTATTISQIETVLKSVPEITSYVANIGSGASLDIGSSGSNSEGLGSFYVNLAKNRTKSSIAITDELRTKLDSIAGAKIVIAEVSAGPPTAPPVEIRLTGNNLAELDRLSLQAMDTLATIEGTIDIDRNLRYSAGEFNFIFKKEALAKAGISISEIAQILRANVFGTEVTTYLDQNSEEIPVSIKAVDQAVNSVDDILAMPVVTSNGHKITVGQVAQVNLQSSLDAIRHRDGKRTITITADAALGYTPNEITQAFMAKKDSLNLPAGYEILIGGEQQATVETFHQLYRSMVIAIILILLILVIEFNSYRQPLIIFLSIPLALIGVLFGLVIAGGQLNFAAFIGLVSLTGIVVNNAIILVDRMNQIREKGVSIKAAVTAAANSRLRPIILTTLTTAGGVAPLIWVDEFFRDMALTLITGLLFSTVITLVLIPILYYRQQTKMNNKRSPIKQQADWNNTQQELSPVP